MKTPIATETTEELVGLETDISKLAHDLRTPLCLILAYAELLAAAKAGPLQPKQSKYVDNIRLAARQISDFIEHIENRSCDGVEAIRDNNNG
jgi:signal transduction histidine kinase